MSILAKNSSEGFTPAPAGQHQAVCVDVIDLGMVERENNGEKKLRHEIRIVYQIAARMESGARFTVASKPFGLSLHQNSALRPFLENWRGGPFSQQEIEDGFDVERLIGANALLNVVHTPSGGNVYANIGTIMPWNSQFGPKIEAENYIRKADRPKQAPAQAGTPQGYSAPQQAFAPQQPVYQQPQQTFYQPPPSAPQQPAGVPDDDIPF
jgi:hypothetical protein